MIYLFIILHLLYIIIFEFSLLFVLRKSQCGLLILMILNIFASRLKAPICSFVGLFIRFLLKLEYLTK